MRDALPLLLRAEQVVVLTIGEDEEAHRPGPAIAAYIARHGAKAQTRADHADDGESGRVILDVARDIDADLVVMGAFSHSRLREMVLGGATEHVIDRATLPVAMSH